MTDHVLRNVLGSAQHQRIVVAEITDVGDPPHQRFDHNRELACAIGLENLAKIRSGSENNLRQRLLKALDFPVIDRLNLPPEVSDVLFLVIAGEEFAETRQGNHFRRQFVAAQDGLKRGRRPGNQSEPKIPGKSRTRVAQLVLAIELSYGIYSRPLLLAQPLAHLRAEG